MADVLGCEPLAPEVHVFDLHVDAEHAVRSARLEHGRVVTDADADPVTRPVREDSRQLPDPLVLPPGIETPSQALARLRRNER